eukprot:142927-Rhodomonas_salina.1
MMGPSHSTTNKIREEWTGCRRGGGEHITTEEPREREGDWRRERVGEGGAWTGPPQSKVV